MGARNALSQAYKIPGNCEVYHKRHADAQLGYVGGFRYNTRITKGNKMGYTTAVGLAEELSLEAGLAYHLQANHYPPVPVAMVQPCIDAIDAYWEDDYNRLIELPQDITWRGQTSAPASAIIEAHHLDAWLQDDEEM